MKHAWEPHPDSETMRRPFQRWRICMHCKAEQEWCSNSEWGRIVGYYWWPLVGRCKGTKMPKSKPAKTDKPKKPLAPFRVVTKSELVETSRRLDKKTGSEYVTLTNQVTMECGHTRFPNGCPPEKGDLYRCLTCRDEGKLT